jgi:Family of unknown function (DUF6252)
MRSLIIVAKLLALCAIMSSCQKEFEDPGDPVIATTSSFTAKVNGLPFTAVLYGGAIRTADSVISLAGKSFDGAQIVFTVVDSGVHVYTLPVNSTFNIGAYVSSNSLNYTSGEGSTAAESGGNLAIVELDTVKRVMSGTFNLKVFRQADGTQKVITEGVFKNISY